MIRPALGYRVRRIGVAEGVEFLLRDEFITDEAAPIVSPRTCEPGPGTLTAIQTDGNYGISGGVMSTTGQSTPAWGALGYVDATGATRSAGVLFFYEVNFTTASYYFWGLHETSSLVAFPKNSFYINQQAGTNRIILYINGGSTGIRGTLANSTAYTWAIVARGTGVFYLIKGGIYSNWTLIYVSNQLNYTPLYLQENNYDSSHDISEIALAQLAAPWDTDNGIATDEKLGIVAEGTAFVHEADCLIEFEVTTRPAGAAIVIYFRYQDSSNYWKTYVRNSGLFELLEVVAGGATQRAVGDNILAGERVVIICDDETIKGYVENDLYWTYTSAANFKTETDGELNTAGPGPGVISDIITWPRVLSGEALAELEKYTQP